MYLLFRVKFFIEKKLLTLADSFHIHYTPIGSANGTIIFDISWGWFNVHTGVALPETLPNIETKTLTLSTTDQYNYKIDPIIINVQPPADEKYGSYFFIRIERTGGTWNPAGVNANELCIFDADLHVIVDRNGSTYEFSDSE